MKSISKNIFYNFLLVGFNIAYPLITASYISKILGAKNIGMINYSQSIINFLLIFAMVGIPTYGIREISQHRENKKEINNIFSELLIIKAFFSLMIFILYFLLLLGIQELKYDKNIFFIMGIILLANSFNIDWFFSGIEDYKVLSLRNIIIKMITFILIIFLIKRSEDYYLYALFITLGQSLGNVWSFFYSKKFVKLKFRNLNFKRHYNGLKIFFLSSLIISVYTLLGGIILGIFSTPEKVAFFSRARQLQLIGITITGSISTVLIPRISYYYINNRDEYFTLLKKSLNFSYILSIPLMIGFIFLSKELNFFLGGTEFLPAQIPLIILSPLILIVTLNTWGYLQVIIPAGMEKLGTIIQIVMAIIGGLLSIILIPKFFDIGVSIAIVIAETVGTIILLIVLKRKIKIKLLTNSFYKYIISGIIMAFFIEIIKRYFNNIQTLTLSILGGGIIYFFILILLKEEIILYILNKIFNKLRRKD